MSGGMQVPLGLFSPKEAELVLKARSKDPRERAEAARDPSTPPEILIEMVKEEDYQIWSALLENPALPKEAWYRLSRMGNPLKRVAVAGHPNAPEELLMKLAREGNPSVRMAVAENRKTPPSALLYLVVKDEGQIAQVAIRNPNLPLRTAWVEAQRRPRLLSAMVDRLLEMGEEDIEVWMEVWRYAGDADRERIEGHPFGRQAALLAKLGE